MPSDSSSCSSSDDAKSSPKNNTNVRTSNEVPLQIDELFTMPNHLDPRILPHVDLIKTLSELESNRTSSSNVASKLLHASSYVNLDGEGEFSSVFREESGGTHRMKNRREVMHMWGAKRGVSESRTSGAKSQRVKDEAPTKSSTTKAVDRHITQSKTFEESDSEEEESVIEYQYDEYYVDKKDDEVSQQERTTAEKVEGNNRLGGCYRKKCIWYFAVVLVVCVGLGLAVVLSSPISHGGGGGNTLMEVTHSGSTGSQEDALSQSETDGSDQPYDDGSEEKVVNDITSASQGAVTDQTHTNLFDELQPSQKAEEVPYKPKVQPLSFRPKGDGNSYGPPIDKGGEGYCREAASKTSDISLPTHAYPNDTKPISRIAFGSCFKPEKQSSSALWNHVRNTFKADLWVWLGDNAYGPTENSMSEKRLAYDAAKQDHYYSSVGPLAEPKIPVIATWDNNDFGNSYDVGGDYNCQASSQAEFSRHFDLPTDDPRHPSQQDNQQYGVYSSHIFDKPNATNSTDGYGLHILLLDSKIHRSPTISTSSYCLEDGCLCMKEKSTMLGDAQWEWLEHELLSESKTSELKLIGSSNQVLPPTYRGKSKLEYCSYDGQNGTFDNALTDLDEENWTYIPNEQLYNYDNAHLGTRYRSFAQIPQERQRLLRLAQRSINEGRTKQIIFLAGDMHWGEIEAKRLSSWSGGDHEDANVTRDNSTYYGASRVLYSVTASGIDQHTDARNENSHRVRVRTADTRGNSVFTQECKFPFRASDGGEQYNDCVDFRRTGKLACATVTEGTNNVMTTSQSWGYCLQEEKELVPRDRQQYSKLNKCTDSYHHTCSAQANYGGIEVDWDARTVTMSVFTPYEVEVVASSISIDF